MSLWLARRPSRAGCTTSAGADSAARAARTSSQPDREAKAAPAAENLRRSRRGISLHRSIPPSGSVVEGELARIEQDPEEVGELLARVALCLPRKAATFARSALRGGGPAWPGRAGRAPRPGPARSEEAVEEGGLPVHLGGVHQPEDLGDPGGVLAGVGPVGGVEEGDELRPGGVGVAFRAAFLAARRAPRSGSSGCR